MISMARIIRMSRPVEWSMRGGDSREHDKRVDRLEASLFFFLLLFFRPFQFAYVVPPPCFGVNRGASVVSDVWGLLKKGKQPMPRARRLMRCGFPVT